jgi:hypothetical protein
VAEICSLFGSARHDLNNYDKVMGEKEYKGGINKWVRV